MRSRGNAEFNRIFHQRDVKKSIFVILILFLLVIASLFLVYYELPRGGEQGGPGKPHPIVITNTPITEQENEEITASANWRK